MLHRLAVVALVMGCGKSDCDRAVRHVFDLTTMGPKPGADEQVAIDAVVKLSVARCEEEGLSDAQRDCILAAPSLWDRTFLTCPALVARKPSWIIAPIGDPDAVPPKLRPPSK